MDRQAFRDIRTGVWDTREYIGMPASAVKFVYVPREVPEPEAARLIREDVWASKLQERKAVLGQANPGKTYQIRPDDETANLALFELGEPDRRKMWSGETVTLAGFEVTGERAEIKVHPISYNEWIACYDSHYAAAFEAEGLPLPYAGIGASALLKTRDGLTPLTRRGIETPVYPGRLYSPGGGPKAGEGSTEALLQEIMEEVGLIAGEHFNPEWMNVMALVSDTHFAGSRHSRPELVATLFTDMTYRQIEAVQSGHAAKKGRQADVWGIEPVSLDPGSLRQFIALHGYEMCPPTEAALAYQMHAETEGVEGPDIAFRKLQELASQLGGFERTDFRPPIRRLA